MHDQDKRYNELAEKWLNGTINEEEKKEFSEWYDHDSDIQLNIPPEFALSEKALRLKILNTITKHKKESATILSIKKRTLFKLAAAAVFAIVAGASFYYYSKQKNGIRQATASIAQKTETNILPGGNKAVLVLADGSKVMLDTATNGTIAKDQNIRVIKLDDGQIAYSSTGEKNVTGYNTLSTPRGGQYAITLADGSKVWLNSASSLRFPAAFAGKERLVELTGEGYFEVAKNSAQPFRVKVNKMDVLVMGTHFNIMAYEDEDLIKTTLLEGSVRIHKNNKIALLKPGEQAHVGMNDNISIKKGADIEEAIAWKNGLFNFEGAGIETIMRQMARWYNIETVYESKITDHFNGTISRNVGIEKVFKMIELTGAVHFIIRGNRVIVRS